MTDFIKGWIVGTVFAVIGAFVATYVKGDLLHCAVPSAAERVADFNAAIMAEAGE